MVTVSMITLLSVKYYCFCVLNYVRDIPQSLILCDITEVIYSEWPNAKLKSVISVPIKQLIYYHYLRAYDIPRVGRISTTYPR